MNRLIAVTGKGGTGKTTAAAALIRLAVSAGVRPVLAVDADPNSTLAPLLGTTFAKTISDIRDQMMEEKARISGVPKERILGLLLEESVVEGKGFDLLVMGRPEGRACYCYVNNLLRRALAGMRSNYPLTVVDNEAGMEHLSRMNTSDVDALLIVCEPTAVSARSALRISRIASELDIRIGRKILVWNKVGPEGVPPKARGILSGETFHSEISLPFTPELAEASADETPLRPRLLPQEFQTLLHSCGLPGIPAPAPGSTGQSRQRE